MKSEDKRCTVEQSKRLVELGVILRTEKQWIKYKEWELINAHNIKYVNKDKLLPAPDVAELGKLLGECEVAREGRRGDVGLYSVRRRLVFIGNRKDLTEAEMRTIALIWLIENNYHFDSTINLEVK